MSSFIHLSAAMGSTIGRAADAIEYETNLSGLSTGFDQIDHLTGGLNPAELIIIAGRPSMGKTSLAINMAFNIAKSVPPIKKLRDKTPDHPVVAFFSLEMTPTQISERILAAEAEIPSARIRSGRLNDKEFARLSACCAEIARLPFYVSNNAELTLQDIIEQSHELNDQYGLDAIFVDYLQLVELRSREGEHRFLEIAEITAGLKKLARHLSVPIVVLSQVARSAETRIARRPELVDLLGSTSIEHDADLVLFVHRESTYIERQRPPEGTPAFNDWQMQLMRTVGLAEITIAKQRQGPEGIIPLAFEDTFTRFGNLARDDRLPERYE